MLMNYYSNLINLEPFYDHRLDGSLATRLIVEDVRIDEYLLSQYILRM